jgi:hypothetical protein
VEESEEVRGGGRVEIARVEGTWEMEVRREEGGEVVAGG